MNEIHKYTRQFVYLDIYGGSADALPTASFLAVDGTISSLTVTQDTVTPGPDAPDDRYHVVLNMAQTQNEGEVSVTWSFSLNSNAVVKVDYFDIVTPYLSIAEVKRVYPEATDEEAIEVEAAVRHIINANTGQSFGYSMNQSIRVEGHGESALRLPKRLIRLIGLETETAVLNPNSAVIVSDGWYLKKGWSEETTEKTTASTYWGGEWVENDVLPGEPGWEKSGHGAVIHAPGSGPNPTAWRNDYPFTVVGDWGYKTVPHPVREAARLLVNDYACMEQLYRDRYLDAIRAADWRLDFSSRAWEFTGNVRADQLLAEYVLLDWAVV